MSGTSTRVVANPIATEMQPDSRIRLGHCARNGRKGVKGVKGNNSRRWRNYSQRFFDRNFLKRLQRETENT